MPWATEKLFNLRRTPLWAAALVVLATVAVYANSFQGVFIFDDEYAIENNPTIRSLWPLGRVFSPPRSGETVSGRPLLNLSLAVNYALGGTNVGGYHAVNLAIHTLAALLLFGILRRTFATLDGGGWTVNGGGNAAAPEISSPFSTPSLPPRSAVRHSSSTSLAFAIALLWAIHPLQTESVTYIVQRAESLVGLLYLLTIYCTVRGASSGRPILWYAMAVLACLLGMATKEVMVTAPLTVLLYDRMLLAGSFGFALRRRCGLYLGLAATWGLLVYLVLSTDLRGGTAGYGAPQAAAPWDYLRSQPAVILHYLRLAIWPHPLCLDYGPEAIATSLKFSGPATILVAVLVAATVWGLIRRARWAMLGAWWFLILTPSSLVPLHDVAFEHRVYLPLAAVITAAVLGVSLAGRVLVRRRLFSPRTSGVFAAGLLLAVSAVLGMLTLARNADYRSKLSIWQDTVAKAPGNERAQNNVGNALQGPGQLESAIAHYRKAVAIKPDYACAHSNLGNALLQQGGIAEALRCYRKALASDPKFAEAYNNLGHALELQGNLAEAVSYYRQALAIRPAYPQAEYNLGVALGLTGKLAEAVVHYRMALALDDRYAAAHYNLGVVLARQGNFAEAAQQYRKALEIDRDYAEAHHNLGSLLAQAGRLAEAVAQFERALELRPDIVEIQRNLATALYQQGKIAPAVAHWRRLVRMQPDAVADLNVLAWTLATYPDASIRSGAEAVAAAQRAASLTGGREPAILDTLAAAYAEAGHFAEAIQAADQALALATGGHDAALAAKINARIKLYRTGAAYRDAK